MMKKLSILLSAGLVTITSALMALNSHAASGNTVVIKPQVYRHALRNPLMGFRPFLEKAAKHPYGSLGEWRIGWYRIEDRESDGADKIREVCNREWGKYQPEAANIKVLPRVVTYTPGTPDVNGKVFLWPSDLEARDWRSDRFKHRVSRLVDKLAKVWDRDSRVGFVEMGIIGSWGEGLRDSVGDTPEIRAILGEAFLQGFRTKKVLVGGPWEWTGYEFGGYWDSFAHADLEQTMYLKYRDYVNTDKRWTRQVFGGECAYNWGNYRVQPGLNPTTTLSQAVHRDYLIDVIRTLHTTYLGWVSNYDAANPQTRQGADEVQQSLGYRFILEEVHYPGVVARNDSFQVSFKVRNDGSAPFYYSWPVELSLLETKTRKVVWQERLNGVDIRTWLPGDNWDARLKQYKEKPLSYTVAGTFALPDQIPPGQYILALAILDPAGRSPAVRFSTVNYFRGGRHPIGLIGVEAKVDHPELNATDFDDPAQDRTLRYTAP
jgi:hypothetical protein